jgi:hypothetical protein
LSKAASSQHGGSQEAVPPVGAPHYTPYPRTPRDGHASHGHVVAGRKDPQRVVWSGAVQQAQPNAPLNGQRSGPVEHTRGASDVSDASQTRATCK